jgi:dihydroorotate dehydrogenase
VRGVAAFADIADYFTINVSSPNTPGLLDCQIRRARRSSCARSGAASPGGTVWPQTVVLVAPDLTLAELNEIVKCASRGKSTDLLSRILPSRGPRLCASPRLTNPAGSLAPLFALSTQMLAAAYLRTEESVSVDRRWRRGQRGNRLRQDRGRRKSRAALYIFLCSRARACC